MLAWATINSMNGTILPVSCEWRRKGVRLRQNYFSHRKTSTQEDLRLNHRFLCTLIHERFLNFVKKNNRCDKFNPFHPSWDYEINEKVHWTVCVCLCDKELSHKKKFGWQMEIVSKVSSLVYEQLMTFNNMIFFGTYTYSRQGPMSLVSCSFQRVRWECRRATQASQRQINLLRKY
jgi:hypothetical protein